MKLRGHDIELVDGYWVYADTGEPTIETWKSRPCGHCGKHNTPEGHDACLGTLPGVKNACCGHGDMGCAYIQFDDGSVVRGQDALVFLESNNVHGRDRRNCRMTHTQKLLQQGSSIEELCETYDLRCCYNTDQTLVILNYSKTNRNKHCPIARECRGLTLEVGTWKLVARAFSRFYNLGEIPEEDDAFDWESAYCEEKEDGSLSLLHNHNGQWRVNTRGSFATHLIEGFNFTWEELFWRAVDDTYLENLHQDRTYVLELCSRYNKVVKDYPQPQAFLLTAFNNDTGLEERASLDHYAECLGVERPEVYRLNNPADILGLIDQFGATDEGVVVIDKFNRRIKIKNKDYVRLHALGTWKLFGGSSAKHIVPLILERPEEEGELLEYFPEIAEEYHTIKERLQSEVDRLERLYNKARKIEDQKEFAEYVMENTPFHSLCFSARKHNRPVCDIWHESSDLILKKLNFDEAV